MSRGARTFETALGFAGIAWDGEAIVCVSLPSADEDDAARHLAKRLGKTTAANASAPPWVKTIIAKITKHFRGEAQDFSNDPIDLSSVPEFHRRVYELAREIPSGQTVTYGELAKLAESPAAARAIGQAMAKNPIPLIIPCHRVMGASQKLTGFTAPGGIAAKQRMLDLERKQEALFRGEGDLPFDPDAAAKSLATADPLFGRLMAQLGPPTLRLKATENAITALAEAIVHQQLAGAAARTIWKRFSEAATGGKPLTPDAVLAMKDSALREAGLSRAKALAVRDLAERTNAGEIPTLVAMRRMSDEEIVEQLTKVRGIGRWTVEMLLIFRLGRADILPMADLGIQNGYVAHFGAPKAGVDVKEALVRRSERWRPFRTIASHYLWRASALPKK